MKFIYSSPNPLSYLTAMGLLILLISFAWMFISLPAYASAPGCQILIPTGSDIADANIDGNLGADWNDANIIQTGSPCMATFISDWDGNSQESGHAVPALQKIVKIYTKQNANNLYMAFEVWDQTQNQTNQQALLNGEKIILQFDPNVPPGGNQLSSDYRIEITHKWSSASLTKKLFDSGTPAGSSICNQQDWREISSNLAIPVGLGVTGSNQNPSSKYTIEIKIPRKLIGNRNPGIGFAVINDLGNGNTGDATGIAFPTSLPLTNAMNVLLPDPLNPAGCGDWLIPDKWGIGGLAFLGDVTISTQPVWWSSQDITALACNNPSYEYYPDKPCELTLQATLHNSSAVDQTRNVLFMWADHGSSPSTWRVIGIKEGVVIPQNGNQTVSSDEWSGVPPNLPNHPCVRAFILPPTYLAAFDKNAILGITNATQLQNMMTAYAFGGPPDPRWAQKNISQHTDVLACPYVCGPKLLPPVANQAIHVSPPPKAQASDTGSDKQPGLFLPDDERAQFSKDVIVQGRAFGYSKSQGKYNFMEDLGGVIQVFPVNLLQQKGKVPFQMNITNQGNVERTIFPQVDTNVGPQVAQVVLDTTPKKFAPGEIKVQEATLQLETNWDSSSYIGTWLALGPVFDPAHQMGDHSPDRNQDHNHPWSDDIICDINNHKDQLDPSKVAPQQGDIVTSYGGQSTGGGSDKPAECKGRKPVAFDKRPYTWTKRHFLAMNWNNVSDIRDDIHTYLTGDYKNDPFDPRNYLNFAGKQHALAFLLVYIIAPETQIPGAPKPQLCIRSDDAVRVWLNGTEIEALKHIGDRGIDESEKCADIQLRPKNTLLAAVANTHVEWGFSATIKNARGLRFTTDNPDKLYTGLAPCKSDYHFITLPGEGNCWNPQDSNRTLSCIGDKVWKGRVSMLGEQFKFAADGNWCTNWGANNMRKNCEDKIPANFQADKYGNKPGIYEVIFDESKPQNPVFILVKPFSQKELQQLQGKCVITVDPQQKP